MYSNSFLISTMVLLGGKQQLRTGYDILMLVSSFYAETSNFVGFFILYFLCNLVEEMLFNKFLFIE